MARNYRFWTTSEIEVLKRGIMPAGRTRVACFRLCRRLGIEYPTAKTFKESAAMLQKFEDKK